MQLCVPRFSPRLKSPRGSDRQGAARLALIAPGRGARGQHPLTAPRCDACQLAKILSSDEPPPALAVVVLPLTGLLLLPALAVCEADGAVAASFLSLARLAATS